MLRIGSLLRNKQLIKKTVLRAGMPGWDRPDPPPTERVSRQTMYSSEDLIYTFFDSSMPEYVLTQPEIYEGTLIQGLPNLFRLWGAVIGSAFVVFLFFKLNNPLRNYKPKHPNYTQFVLSQSKKIVEDKVQLKNMKQNPFGFKINSQQYPALNHGKVVFSPLFYNIQEETQLYSQISKQARNYLNGVQERSKHKKNDAHHAHH